MPATTSDPTNQRFGETAKFLPVLFVVCNISGLYLIYMLYHAVPKAFVGTPMGPAPLRVIIEVCVFNAVTALMVWCYVSCILVHPGTVPDKDEDPSWEYVPKDNKVCDNMLASAGLQETKRSGDRRHCKWCAKYKPDRCHHCRVCRMCILKMDHHCPWIYNCVGFHNHKYFFLLLFYATLDCHIMTWTMLPSVKGAIESNAPFMTMFLLLFGETLAAFIAVLVTAFFSFHIWLMMKAMTTIEFCEKSLKKTGYDSSVYDRGPLGNIESVLGDQPLFWLVPGWTPSGRGLDFPSEDLDRNRSKGGKSSTLYGATFSATKYSPETDSAIPMSRDEEKLT